MTESSSGVNKLLLKLLLELIERLSFTKRLIIRWMHRVRYIPKHYDLTDSLHLSDLANEMTGEVESLDEFQKRSSSIGAAITNAPKEEVDANK